MVNGGDVACWQWMQGQGVRSPYDSAMSSSSSQAGSLVPPAPASRNGLVMMGSKRETVSPSCAVTPGRDGTDLRSSRPERESTSVTHTSG